MWTGGGRLRNGPVFIKGTRHTPPNAALVSDELDALIKWIIARCIRCWWRLETHFRFETLHPLFRWQRAHRTIAAELATLASGLSADRDLKWKNGPVILKH